MKFNHWITCLSHVIEHGLSLYGSLSKRSNIFLNGPLNTTFCNVKKMQGNLKQTHLNVIQTKKLTSLPLSYSTWQSLTKKKKMIKLTLSFYVLSHVQYTGCYVKDLIQTFYPKVFYFIHCHHRSILICYINSEIEYLLFVYCKRDVQKQSLRLTKLLQNWRLTSFLFLFYWFCCLILMRQCSFEIRATAEIKSHVGF